jgi:hypothetical protein
MSKSEICVLIILVDRRATIDPISSLLWNHRHILRLAGYTSVPAGLPFPFPFFFLLFLFPYSLCCVYILTVLNLFPLTYFLHLLGKLINTLHRHVESPNTL